MIKAQRLPESPNGDRTYQLDNGKLLSLSYHDLWLHREVDLLMMHGVQLSHERLPVMRYGSKLGTLPRSFDWKTERVTSPLVDLRRGDFELRSGPNGDYWEASPTLGPGDLDSILAFRRN